MKGAIAWFARNHVAANLMMVLFVAGGLVSLPRIHQKMFPDFEIDIVQVAVVHPGAAPEEVEQGVCVRIEEEIQSIEGIENFQFVQTLWEKIFLREEMNLLTFEKTVFKSENTRSRTNDIDKTCQGSR